MRGTKEVVINSIWEITEKVILKPKSGADKEEWEYQTMGHSWETTTMLVWISPLRWRNRKEVPGKN